jgi:hypothetical protein
LLLNIHYSERKYFEWHRALVGLANQCCLITETAEGYGDLVPGKHFVMADREDLLACCEYYLTHPDEAETIAQAGSDFVRTQLRQAQSCRSFLFELESGRVRSGTESLATSTDARPVPLSPALSQRFHKRHARQLKDALTSDLKNLLRKTESAPVLSPLLEQEAPSRLSVITKREACQNRWLEQAYER